MKIMSKVNAAKAAVATGLTTFAVSANAALPESLKTAIDGSKADGLVSTHSRLKAAGPLMPFFCSDMPFQHTAA